jgi:hypothetical protein
MKNSISVREVIVHATEDALNAAVTEHQIEPDKIIWRSQAISEPAFHEMTAMPSGSSSQGRP